MPLARVVPCVVIPVDEPSPFRTLIQYLRNIGDVPAEVFAEIARAERVAQMNIANMRAWFEAVTPVIGSITDGTGSTTVLLPGQFYDNITPSPLPNGATTAFVLPASPITDDALMFTWNGQILYVGGRITSVVGPVVQLNFAPSATSILRAWFRT